MEWMTHLIASADRYTSQITAIYRTLCITFTSRPEHTEGSLNPVAELVEELFPPFAFIGGY